MLLFIRSKNGRKVTCVSVLYIVLAILVAVSTGCTRQRTAADDVAAAEGVTIRIGSKNFTEQLILSHITMLALGENGIGPAEKTILPGTAAIRAALEAGEIDIYWEYTGTAWRVIMGREPVGNDTPRRMFERVRETDTPNGIVWAEPAPLNNTFVLLMTRERSQALGVRTLSELSAHMGANPGQLRLASIHAFTIRPDGLPGLREVYGIDFGGNIDLMVQAMVYYTLDRGLVDVAVATATDWRIKHYGFVVLEDDKHFFPFYNPAPNIRTEVLERHPQILDILNPISARLTDRAIRNLNFLVDRQGMSPTGAAAQWLRAEGFIQ